VPAFTELESWANANGVQFSSRKELVENPKVKDHYAKEIEENMKDYARVEQIRKFALLNTEWSQETDELTPTLKLKRRVINQKYDKIIESLYPAED
ncbi:MAG TPA: long-chain fatty acid--CoA ligase, partial [Desulfomonilia bacterium]|nr:long-chain fatty acid--CoA ligase [Desulfomonilia bacterium]